MDNTLAEILAWLAGDTGEATRNWITTLGGLIALTVALATYVRNVRLKREEQARMVYATLSEPEELKIGDPVEHQPAYDMFVGPDAFDWNDQGTVAVVAVPLLKYRVTIHNKSKELITRISVQLEGPGYLNEPPYVTIDTCGPEREEVREVVVAYAYYFRRPSLTTWLEFLDSTGRAWTRWGANPIRSTAFNRLRGLWQRIDRWLLHRVWRNEEREELPAPAQRR